MSEATVITLVIGRCVHNSRPVICGGQCSTDCPLPWWKAAGLDGSPEVCTIFGSEIEFKMEVPRVDLEKVCQDIWDHPDRYSKWQPGTEEAWYNFIKFLWVKMPNGQVKRLADLAVRFREGADDEN